MQTSTKKLYTIKEFCKDVMPLSEGGAYKAVCEGKIPSVKVGKRVFIPSWYIDQLLDEPTNGGVEA